MKGQCDRTLGRAAGGRQADRRHDVHLLRPRRGVRHVRGGSATPSRGLTSLSIYMDNMAVSVSSERHLERWCRPDTGLKAARKHMCTQDSD